MSETSRLPRGEVVAFILCVLLYAALVFGWNVVPLVQDDDGTMVSIADSAMTGLLPWFGGLPAQSISKFVLCIGLYLTSLIFAVVVIAISRYREYLLPMLIIGVLTFVSWVALNYWVIAGFLNSPNTLLYGGISVILLLAWGGALLFGVLRFHDATAAFLIRYGVALSMFMTIVQLAALLTPEWRSPTQGIPVLYNLNLNALVGLFLAGVGGNMVWRERRMQALAGAGKRR